MRSFFSISANLKRYFYFVFNKARNTFEHVTSSSDLFYLLLFLLSKSKTNRSCVLSSQKLITINSQKPDSKESGFFYSRSTL